MPSSSSRLICSCSRNSNTTIPAFRDLRLFLFSGPIIAHNREFASLFCHLQNQNKRAIKLNQSYFVKGDERKFSEFLHMRASVWFFVLRFRSKPFQARFLRHFFAPQLAIRLKFGLNSSKRLNLKGFHSHFSHQI